MIPNALKVMLAQAFFFFLVFLAGLWLKRRGR